MSKSGQKTTNQYTARVVNFFARDLNRLLDTHRWRWWPGDLPRTSSKQLSLRDELKSLPKHVHLLVLDYYQRNWIVRFFVWLFNVNNIIKYRHLYSIYKLQRLLESSKALDLAKLETKLQTGSLNVIVSRFSGLQECITRLLILIKSPELVESMPTGATLPGAFQASLGDINRHLATLTWRAGKARKITATSQHSLLSELADEAGIELRIATFKRHCAFVRFVMRRFNVGDINKYRYLNWVVQIRRELSSGQQRLANNQRLKSMLKLPMSDHSLEVCTSRLAFYLDTGVFAAPPAMPANVQPATEMKATPVACVDDDSIPMPLTAELRANLNVLAIGYDAHDQIISLSLRFLKKRRDKLMLKFHPDHNRSPDAKVTTVNILTAYKAVVDTIQKKLRGSQTISDLYHEFLDLDAKLSAKLERLKREMRAESDRIARALSELAEKSAITDAMMAKNEAKLAENGAELAMLRTEISAVAVAMREAEIIRVARATSPCSEVPVIAPAQMPPDSQTALLLPARGASSVLPGASEP